MGLRRFLMRATVVLFGTGCLCFVDGWAQTPAPSAASLIDALSRPGVKDTERWKAATQLGATTFTDATEKTTAVTALSKALSAREIGLRVNAATALGTLRDAASVPVLSKAMLDSSVLVRQAAARSLGEIATETAAKTLLRAIGDPNLHVRAQVVHALGETRQPLAIIALENVLLSQSQSPNAPLRAEAAKGLAAIGSPATETLARAAESEDEDVRRLAVTALSDMGDPRAVPALLSRLSDRNPRIAAGAVAGLSRIGEPAIPRLIDSLNAPDDSVRRNAAVALAGIGAPAVAPLKVNYGSAMVKINELQEERADAQVAMEDAKRPRVAASSQNQPPASQPSAAQPAAPTFADDSDVVVMSDAALKRELKQKTKDVKKVQKRAYEAERLTLLRRAEDSLNERIQEAQNEYQSPEPFKPANSQLISGIVPLAAAPKVAPSVPTPPQPAVNGSSTATGAPAARTFRPLATIDAEIDALRRRAHAVILALGQIGNPESVTAIAEILQSGEITEATLAAESLGRTGSADAVAPLERTAQDASFPTSVRANAAQGLGRLRAESSRATLQQLSANDPSPIVRTAAVKALTQLP